MKEDNEILRNIIINLEKKYKHLEELYNQLLKDYDDAITRIDKAIEYINEEYYAYPQELTGLIDGDELLKILKGDSNES